MTSAFAAGPYLSAAVICERVLEEKDGVKSLVRIIDRLTHTAAGPNPPRELEAFDYTAAMFLRFKSGTARGPMRLEITYVKPSGESVTPGSISLQFEGEDDRGVDVVVPLNVRIEHTGVHWFNITLDGTLVTRLPFRIVYNPQVVNIPRPRDS